MTQNVIIRSNSDALLVAANNSSAFVNFLTSYLKEPQYVNVHSINGVMNNFDAQEHEGVVFRGTLLEWLWNNRGRKAQVSVE